MHKDVNTCSLGFHEASMSSGSSLRHFCWFTTHSKLCLTVAGSLHVGEPWGDHDSEDLGNEWMFAQASFHLSESDLETTDFVDCTKSGEIVALGDKHLPP